MIHPIPVTRKEAEALAGLVGAQLAGPSYHYLPPADGPSYAGDAEGLMGRLQIRATDPAQVKGRMRTRRLVARSVLARAGRLALGRSLLPVVNQFGDLGEGERWTHTVTAGNHVDQLVVEEPARSVLGFPEIDVGSAAVLLIDREGLLAESWQTLETPAFLARDFCDMRRVEVIPVLEFDNGIVHSPQYATGRSCFHAKQGPCLSSEAAISFDATTLGEKPVIWTGKSPSISRSVGIQR